MKKFNLKNFKKGWVIGSFEEALYRTLKYELAFKYYKSGDYEPAHYHLMAEEMTVILKGVVEMNNVRYIAGDIIIISRGEPTDFKCIEDAITGVYKTKSVLNDKFIVNKETILKECTRCLTTKASEAFGKRSKIIDGQKRIYLKSHCHQCEAELAVIFKSKNPPKKYQNKSKKNKYNEREKFRRQMDDVKNKRRIFNKNQRQKPNIKLRDIIASSIFYF